MAFTAIRCLALTFLTVGFAGCTSHAVKTVVLKESKDGEESKTPGNSGGLTYYLPMRYARVTFERAELSSKPAEAHAAATATGAEREAALKKATAAAETFKTLVADLTRQGGAVDAEVLKKAKADWVAAQVEAARAKVALTEATADLAKAGQALADYKQSKPMCGYVDSIKVTLLDPMPDRSARFELQARHSSARHDHFSIGTTPSGLLKTVDAELKDQSGEILVSLAKSLAAGGQPVGLRSLSPETGVAPAGINCDDLLFEPISLTRIIDPSISDEWKEVATAINESAGVKRKSTDEIVWTFKYALTIESQRTAVRAAAAASSATTALTTPTAPTAPTVPAAVPPGTSSAPTGQAVSPAPTTPTAPATQSQIEPELLTAGDEFDGVLYRRERPLLVKATLAQARDGSPCRGTCEVPIGGFVLLVPNGAARDTLHVQATAFVENKFKVGFDNGMLVSVDSTRPSEILEVVSTPWKIAEATLGILTNLIQLRVNYATSEAALVEQEAALLAQLKAKLEAERALEKARNADEDDDEEADAGAEPSAGT